MITYRHKMKREIAGVEMQVYELEGIIKKGELGNSHGKTLKVDSY